MREFIPYFELHAADVMMIDVAWNGSRSPRRSETLQRYIKQYCAHNYYSHIATYMSASLCAVLPNVRIMEIDIDDVPWKDDLVTDPPEIIDGYMTTPTKPGWGTDLNEEEVKKHLWENRSAIGKPMWFELR